MFGGNSHGTLPTSPRISNNETELAMYNRLIQEDISYFILIIVLNIG